MMTRSTDDRTVDEIISDYIRAASAHEPAILAGNAEAAVSAYDTVAACADELRFRGLDAQKALLLLLEHKNLRVQLCAATDALESAPALAETKLLSLSHSASLVGLDASAILREWQKGNVKFH
jgi:hypothetical protein